MGSINIFLKLTTGKTHSLFLNSIARNKKLASYEITIFEQARASFFLTHFPQGSECFPRHRGIPDSPQFLCEPWPAEKIE